MAKNNLFEAAKDAISGGAEKASSWVQEQNTNQSSAHSGSSTAKNTFQKTGVKNALSEAVSSRGSSGSSSGNGRSSSTSGGSVKKSTSSSTKTKNKIGSFSSTSKKQRLDEARRRMDEAQTNLGYVTDEFSEAAARKEYEDARAAYEAAQKEYDSSTGTQKSYLQEALNDLGIQERTQQNTNEPVQYNDADFRQMDINDSWSPNWTNGVNRAGVNLPWLENTAKAAVTGVASGLTGAQRALFEAGQAGRTGANTEQLNETARTLARIINDRRVAEQEGNTEDLESYDYQIESYNRTLKGLADALGPDVYQQTLDNFDIAFDEFDKNPENKDAFRIFESANDGLELRPGESVQERATRATSEMANELQQESSVYTEAAKKAAGDNWLGNFGTDIAVNAIQMAGDAATNLVVPGWSLINMGLRTFGSSAQEAEASGASIGQQLGYAAVKGGVEMATEMMFDGLAGIYGKGEADEIVEEVIRRIGKDNEVANTALRMLFSGLGEAAEEGVSGVADPLAKTIYEGIGAIDPRNITKEDVSNLLYDMLVGFAMGGAGSTVNILTGENAEANATLANRNAIQSELESQGVDRGKARRLAPIVEKAQNGEELTSTEVNLLLSEKATQNLGADIAGIDLNADLADLDFSGRNNEQTEAEQQTQAETATEQETAEQNAPPTPEDRRARIQQGIENTRKSIESLRGNNAPANAIAELEEHLQKLRNQLEEINQQIQAQSAPMAEGERNTAGEERAENQAPQAPAPNPLVTPQTVNERSTSGEERAEGQAPEVPTVTAEETTVSAPETVPEETETMSREERIADLDNIQKEQDSVNEQLNALKDKGTGIFQQVKTLGTKVHTVFGKGEAYEMPIGNGFYIHVEFGEGKNGTRFPSVYLIRDNKAVSVGLNSKSYDSVSKLVADTDSSVSADATTIVDAIEKMSPGALQSLTDQYRKTVNGLRDQLAELRNRAKEHTDVLRSNPPVTQVEAEGQAPTAPAANPLVTHQTVGERSTAGEARAEQQSPEYTGRAEADIQTDIDRTQKDINDLDNAIADIKAEAQKQPTHQQALDFLQQFKETIDIFNAEKQRLSEELKAFAEEKKAAVRARNAAKEARAEAGREARGAKKVPNPQPETHIDNRTDADMSSRKVNAFQYDNPEVKPFYKRAAEILRRDLITMFQSKRTGKNGGTVFGKTSSFLKNFVGMYDSVADAIEACEQIIYDKGRENAAAPKRVEVFLDRMLVDGYTPVDESLPSIIPDLEYQEVKGRLEGGTPHEETGYYNPDTRDGEIQPLDVENENIDKFTPEEIDEVDTKELEEKYGKNSEEIVEESPEESAATEQETTAEEETEEAEPEKTEPTSPEETSNESESTSTETGTEGDEASEGINTRQEEENAAEVPNEEFNSKPESETRTTEQIQQEIDTETETVRLLRDAEAPQEIIERHEQRIAKLNGELETVSQQERQTAIETEIAELEEQLANMGRGEGRTDLYRRLFDLRRQLDEIRAKNTTATEAETSTNNGPWVPPTKESSGGKTKASQTSTNSMRNTAQQNGAEQETLYYVTKPEQESLNNAMNRVSSNMVGEMNDLVGKETWTGEDFDTAYTIYGKLKYDSVKNRDSSAADAWARVVQQHGTRAGQALQAMSKWARTGTAIAAAADNAINDIPNLPEEQKQQIKNDIFEMANEFDGVEDGDLDAIKKLILKQNDYRKTGTFNPKTFSWLLDKVDNFEWLKEYAARQMMAMSSDFTETADLGQKIKTWQVNAQLSRLGTFFRNLGGNASFGAIDTAAQNFFGYAIDSLVSKLTGKREVGWDKSWLSNKGRQAATDAMVRSMLEVAGDVDMTGDTTRYGTTSNRTNKMNGDPFERFMSRWEQLLGYSLTTSDRFFRGQAEASVAEGLMQQGVSEAEANEIARMLADYRLFQNQGVAAGLSKGIHDLFNRIGIGGEVRDGKRVGGFGVGDLINPYPGVPANLAVKALEYSPLNIVKGGAEIVKLLSDAKAGKTVTGQQMTAVMDIARGMTGAPIIALFVSLAKSGLFKNSDDEDDYDVQAENTAQGLSGVQWNLSATMRAFDGEIPEWKNGDQLMKISWLEPMNAFMSIASLISSTDTDADIGTYAGKYFEGTVQSILDLPVMENIQNVVNTFKYSTAENLGGKMLDAGAQFAGDTVSGMIPAPVSQLARGTDEYARDTKGNSKPETAFNALLNSIPGLRSTLPVKTDNFGNPRINEASPYNRLMNSFVRPGSINTFQETDVQDEISRLYEQTGDVALYPDRNGPKSLEIDGEKYDLTADESRAYHELAGQTSEQYVKELLDSDYYNGLTDEQKNETVKEMYTIAKDVAKADYFEGKDIVYDSNTQALLKGVNKPGTNDDKTAIKPENLADYVSLRTQYKDALKSEDYDTVDSIIKGFKKLDKNMQAVVSERFDNFKGLQKYISYGASSKDYYAFKAGTQTAKEQLDSSSDSSLVHLLGIANADMSEATRKKLIMNGDSNTVSAGAKAAYTTLNKYGYKTSDVYDFFNTCLNCASKNGTPVDQKGNLKPDTVAYALSQMKGLTDQQRSEIYNEIKPQVSNYYNDWKNYSYSAEISYINNRSKYTYSMPKNTYKSMQNKSGSSTPKLPNNPLLGGISSGVKSGIGKK